MGTHIRSITHTQATLLTSRILSPKPAPPLSSSLEQRLLHFSRYSGPKPWDHTQFLRFSQFRQPIIGFIGEIYQEQDPFSPRPWPPALSTAASPLPRTTAELSPVLTYPPLSTSKGKSNCVSPLLKPSSFMWSESWTWPRRA